MGLQLLSKGTSIILDYSGTLYIAIIYIINTPSTSVCVSVCPIANSTETTASTGLKFCILVKYIPGSDVIYIWKSSAE